MNAVSQSTIQTSERPIDETRARSNGMHDGNALSWPYLLGGGALVFAAMRGGLLRGLALSGAGAAVAYRGATGRWPLVASQPSPSTMKASVTINMPAEELYDLWRDVESFEYLLPHVESVASHAGRSHWEAELPAGRTLEWTAEVIREERPRRIEWRTTAESDIQMTGTVTFKEPPGNRGTEVQVVMSVEPPAGKLGSAIAGPLLKLPEQQLRRDLKNLKRKLEAGELPTTSGQPHGSRKTFSITNGSSA